MKSENEKYRANLNYGKYLDDWDPHSGKFPNINDSKYHRTYAERFQEDITGGQKLAMLAVLALLGGGLAFLAKKSKSGSPMEQHIRANLDAKRPWSHGLDETDPLVVRTGKLVKLKALGALRF